MNNAGRAARVLCPNFTKFAILSRKDYKLTIGQEERRKLKQNVKSLRQFSIFSSPLIRDNTIERVYQYMKTIKKFQHGNHVYRESVSKIDGLYFIRSGDFEITQQVEAEKIITNFKPAKKALSRYGNKSMQEDGLKMIVQR